jgi:hypothetical protein
MTQHANLDNGTGKPRRPVPDPEHDPHGAFRQVAEVLGYDVRRREPDGPQPPSPRPPATSANGVPARPAPPTAAERARLVTTRLDGVRPEPVRWLIPGYVPAGKMTLLAGDGGHGKSVVTLHVAACLGTGRPCFGLDYAPPPPGETLLINCEDDRADTVVPRLIALGADLARVHWVDGVPGENGKTLGFNLACYERLEGELAQRPAVRLVVIDPAGAYVGAAGVDDHKDSELRGLLGPLTELAARRVVSVVLVKHLSKGAGAKAVDKVSGSAAYVNAVRSVLAVAPDPDEPVRKYLMPIKGNLGKPPAALAFRHEELPAGESAALLAGPTFAHLGDEGRALMAGQLFRPAWLGPADVDPNEVTRGGRREVNKVQRCAGWLEKFLATHAYPSQEILDAAAAEGFTFDNVKEAKALLKAKGLRNSTRGQRQGGWWSGFGDPREWALRPEPAQPARGQTGEPAPRTQKSPQSPESPGSDPSDGPQTGETGEIGETFGSGGSPPRSDILPFREGGGHGSDGYQEVDL